MIDQVVKNVLEDGQLDDCELTFTDIEKIGAAFFWVVSNVFHHRIDYPGFDFNRRQRKRDTGPLPVGAKTVAAGG